MTRRLLFALSLTLLALAPSAQAASNTAVFGLRAVGNPKVGYFVYDLSPGATTSGAVIVSNVGTAAGTAKLYAVDATTGSTTGTVYVTDHVPAKQGTWVSLSQTRVLLAPGAHASVGFTVHVPPGAKPGQWVAGIVAENATQVRSQRTKGKAGVRINVRNLTIVAVQTNVAGHLVAGFRVGGVTPGGRNGYQQLAVHFANTGNVLEKPSGRVEILRNGAPVETLAFHMDTFLPQTSIDYPLLLRKALSPGSYTARVTLSYPSAAGPVQTVTASPAFSVSKQNVTQVFRAAAPTRRSGGARGGFSSLSTATRWALIGAIAAALVLLLSLLLVFLRRRRRGLPVRARTGGEPPAAPAPEPRPRHEPPDADLVAEHRPRRDPPRAAPVVERAAPRPPRTGTDCAHYWDVAYDRGELGGDGAWRFPHRCRNCGREVLAANVEDAAAQASSLPQPAGR